MVEHGQHDRVIRQVRQDTQFYLLKIYTADISTCSYHLRRRNANIQWRFGLAVTANSAPYPQRHGKLSTDRSAVMLCGWGVKAGWPTCGWQVKLCDPSSTRAIPERLRYEHHI